MSEPEKVRVFHNTYKTADKHPDFSNKGVQVFGKSLDVAVWKNQDKNGNDYLNIQFEPAYEKADSGHEKADKDSDDALPF